LELSYPEYLDVKEQSQTLEQVAAMPTTVYGYSMVLTDHGEPQQIESARVSANFFETLGAEPALGRTFLPEEDQAGEVVLSHGLFERLFGGDPGVLNGSMTLDGKSFTVVGVMPSDFDFPKGSELWAPLASTMSRRVIEGRGAVFLKFVGRL